MSDFTENPSAALAAFVADAGGVVIATEPVDGGSDERGEGVHPEDVDADDEADELQRGAAVVHVDRGHDHDGDHDRVPEGDDRDRGEGRRVGTQGGHPASPLGSLVEVRGGGCRELTLVEVRTPAGA